MRGETHVLHAATDGCIGFTAGNGLRREMHGFEARSADAVDGERRRFEGKSRLDGSLSRRILASRSSEHLPHDDLTHQRRLDLRAFEQRPDDRGTEFDGRNLRERSPGNRQWQCASQRRQQHHARFSPPLQGHFGDVPVYDELAGSHRADLVDTHARSALLSTKAPPTISR